jgi:hypothetical protein
VSHRKSTNSSIVILNIYNLKILLRALFLISIFFIPQITTAQHKPDKKRDILFYNAYTKGTLIDTTYQRAQRDHSSQKLYFVRMPPEFMLQFTGGFNLGFAELSSNYADVFDAEQFVLGENFGVRYGIGFNAIGKYTINEKGNLRLNVSAGYNHFNSGLLSKKSPFGKVKYNLFTIGAGIENNFNPKFRLRPYVAFEANFNLISGSAAIINDSGTTNINIKSSFRIGYTIYSGFEYLINNSYGITFGARLTNANQILKQTKDEGTGNDIYLRDKRVSPRILLSGFKNFVFVSFYIGVNLYFGIKEQRFKV